MQSLKALYLDSVRRAVTETLLPELQTDMARHRVDLINMILSRMVVMESGLPGMLRNYWAGIAPKLDELNASLPEDHPAVATLDSLAAQLALVPGEDVLVEDWDAQLAETMQLLLQMMKHQPFENSKLLITSLAVDEDVFREAYERQIGNLMASKADVADSGEPPINDESVSAYLRQRFPETAGIRAEQVTNVPGGRSKSTIMFDMLADDGSVEQVVMRKDFPVNFLETAVVAEFPMLQILADQNAPVARPLWVETDSSHFGTPFMVSEKVAGKTAGNLFSVAEASRPAGLELARVLAFFHSLDLDETGLAAHVQFGHSESAAHELVAYWYQRWKSGASTASVILEAAFTWLHDRKDVVDITRRLVHGDAGIHNLLIEGDHVTALVDWEFAHAGDAAEDLAYCRNYVRQFMDWDEFLEHYLETGGPSVSPAQLDYWGVWAAVRNAVATNLAYKSYVSGEDRDLRVAAMGMNTYPKLLYNLAKALKGAN